MIFVACVHVVFGFYLELLLHKSLMCDLRKDTLFNNYFGFERLGVVSLEGGPLFPKRGNGIIVLPGRPSCIHSYE